MSNPTKLQHRVQDELEWEPSLDASRIGVAARAAGIVTLTGAVATYAEKVAAERATKRVAGVRAIANDIEVQPVGAAQRSDTAIAQAVLQALEADTLVPHERLTVRVEDGWVTLEGELPLQFQRACAEAAVRRLQGVRGITNQIRLQVRPALEPKKVKSRIRAAFHRSAEIDARNIEVDAADGAVILRGKVRTWSEREEAERAAWGAPGVQVVKDELIVGI